MIFRRQMLHAITIAAGTMGCGAPPAASPPSGAAAAASPIAPTAAATAPRIVGTVHLSSTHNPPASGGVVYIDDAPKQPGVATTATIDVDHKVFSPLITIITTGGTVTFRNKDALAHHVFSPDVAQWDTGYLRKNDTAGRTFDSPGAVALLCNIHPEMIGYVLVIPSTYFGKLGADGTYVVSNLPPGTYKATAWVPRMPTVTQSVTVGTTGAVTANFEVHPEGS
jgi:plastocyanin